MRAATLVLCALLLVPATARAETYMPPVRGPILRHFEPPPTKYEPGHRGIDIGAEPGTAVVASASGVVAFAGAIGTEKYISIDHPDGLRTTYSFLSLILVKKGRSVARGSTIGESGNGHPGSPLGPHLHFGVKRGEDYLDPEPLLLEGFRHDYSSIVRLTPLGDPGGAGTVGAAFMPLVALLPLWRARRRSSGRPYAEAKHRHQEARAESADAESAHAESADAESADAETADDGCRR